LASHPQLFENWELYCRLKIKEEEFFWEGGKGGDTHTIRAAKRKEKYIINIYSISELVKEKKEKRDNA
jgi:hypothetical protein